MGTACLQIQVGCSTALDHMGLGRLTQWGTICWHHTAARSLAAGSSCPRGTASDWMTQVPQMQLEMLVSVL